MTSSPGCNRITGGKWLIDGITALRHLKRTAKGIYSPFKFYRIDTVGTQGPVPSFFKVLWAEDVYISTRVIQ